MYVYITTARANYHFYVHVYIPTARANDHVSKRSREATAERCLSVCGCMHFGVHTYEDLFDCVSLFVCVSLFTSLFVLQSPISLQKSPNSVKEPYTDLFCLRLCLYYRALYLCKRALYLHKRALFP